MTNYITEMKGFLTGFSDHSPSVPVDQDMGIEIKSYEDFNHRCDEGVVTKGIDWDMEEKGKVNAAEAAFRLGEIKTPVRNAALRYKAARDRPGFDAAKNKLDRYSTAKKKMDLQANIDNEGFVNVMGEKPKAASLYRQFKNGKEYRQRDPSVNL
jgi:hypothetical protein